jgi:hypothetical protein
MCLSPPVKQLDDIALGVGHVDERDCAESVNFLFRNFPWISAAVPDDQIVEPGKLFRAPGLFSRLSCNAGRMFLELSDAYV